MKYWNERRIQRVKDRKKKKQQRAIARAKEAEEQSRTYTKGDTQKNLRLMLDALGSERNRRLLARLRTRGAMSVSKLAEPYGITLPAAMDHIHALERAGLIHTHKRGRIRFCVYNPAALQELSASLSSKNPFGR